MNNRPGQRATSGVTFAALLACGALMLTVSRHPLVLAIAGIVALVIVAWARWRARIRSVEDALAVQRRTLGWALLSGGFWLGTLVAARVGSPVFPFVMWAAVAAGAMAIGEACAMQRQRVETGRSGTPPWVLVVAAIVLLLVQPVLFPATAVVIALLDRRESASQ